MHACMRVFFLPMLTVSTTTKTTKTKKNSVVIGDCKRPTSKSGWHSVGRMRSGEDEGWRRRPCKQVALAPASWWIRAGSDIYICCRQHHGSKQDPNHRSAGAKSRFVLTAMIMTIIIVSTKGLFCRSLTCSHTHNCCLLSRDALTHCMYANHNRHHH
mmetsp:Transcript_20207/g.57365  ORF Transcript_20207/g.57365 Transcript_20207/m.57365 type:complete len:157 (-) Transcript_20207:45-515(-)